MQRAWGYLLDLGRKNKLEQNNKIGKEKKICCFMFKHMLCDKIKKKGKKKKEYAFDVSLDMKQ